MATVFVTGGSGFLGGRLIQTLVARGDRVKALARSDKAAAAVQALGAEPVKGDLTGEAAMAAGMQGCAAVFHCAASVGDFGKLAEFRAINVGGTERVLAAARAAGVPRLVHVSTEAVLVGGGPIVDADETRPRPAHPQGVYPITKGEAEAAVLAANSPGLATVIVRPRLIWGAGDTTVLPTMAEMVRKGQFAWFSGGRYKTSTCHVQNVVEGMLLAAEKGRPGEIYFLTDGEPVEFRSFATAMLEAVGARPGDRSVPFGLALAAGALAEAAWSLLGLRGEPPLTRTAVRLIGEEVTVRDAKARAELGYVGRVSREEGLRELAARNAR